MQKTNIPIKLGMSPDGETGIRARLKILFSEKGSAGSTPAWGTKIKIMKKNTNDK